MRPGDIIIPFAAVGVAHVKDGVAKLQGIDTLLRSIHGSTILSNSFVGRVVISIMSLMMYGPPCHTYSTFLALRKLLPPLGV